MKKSIENKPFGTETSAAGNYTNYQVQHLQLLRLIAFIRLF